MTTLTGSSTDLQARVLKVVPRRWFKWVAPIRDAILGALSDLAAWNYGLIGYAKAQTRLATAYGVWLDILCFDFLGPTLTRAGLLDDSFRALIQATILQERVTRAGMANIITRLTGNAPWIFEPWNTGDTGAYGNIASGVVAGGQMGYGVGHGGYGSMQLPAQAFMQVHRTTPSGVPNVDGYQGSMGGYGAGAVEYIGNTTQLQGITDQVIYDAIKLTKPTGSIVWVAFTALSRELTTDSGAPLTDGSSDTLFTG